MRIASRDMTLPYQCPPHSASELEDSELSQDTGGLPSGKNSEVAVSGISRHKLDEPHIGNPGRVDKAQDF